MGQTNINVQIGSRQAINVKFKGVVGSQAIKFTPFSFIATDGQTDFVLSAVPKGEFFIANVNGTAQNKEAGDFTIVGNVLKMDEGLDEGDNLYGLFIAV